MFKDNEILKRIDDLEKQIQALTEMVKPKEKKPRKKKKQEEIWSPIIHKGYMTTAEVSNKGNVRYATSKKPMSIFTVGGTNTVVFRYTDNEGEKHTSSGKVANLVIRAFVDPELPEKTRSVGFIDGNPDNASVDNLYIKKGE